MTIWAVTCTVSGGGDQGADPNKVVAITDRLGAQTLPAGESFRTLEAARSGQVLRGVSFTPGTGGTDPAVTANGTGGRVVPAARSLLLCGCARC